jgi:nucleoside-diphosphate-sugar epimerase
MGSSGNNVALVFGASGISGWAVCNNLLSYPTRTTFSRVVGLSNRPVDRATSLFPDDEPRLEFYSGVNLRGDLATVKKQLEASVPDVQNVTHVYYLGEQRVSLSLQPTY